MIVLVRAEILFRHKRPSPTIPLVGRFARIFKLPWPLSLGGHDGIMCHYQDIATNKLMAFGLFVAPDHEHKLSADSGLATMDSFARRQYIP